MKRPIHLYIFVALSTIATVLRIHGAFLSRFDEASYRALFDGVQVEGLDNLVAMAQASADFTSNLINKGLRTFTSTWQAHNQKIHDFSFFTIGKQVLDVDLIWLLLALFSHKFARLTNLSKNKIEG